MELVGGHWISIILPALLLSCPLTVIYKIFCEQYVLIQLLCVILLMFFSSLSPTIVTLDSVSFVHNEESTTSDVPFNKVHFPNVVTLSANVLISPDFDVPEYWNFSSINFFRSKSYPIT